MKKLKRTDGWEDSPLVSSKSFQEEFDELDEEIIELDDEIIELPTNGVEDHEEPAFDVEILDEDRQLDLRETEDKAESEEEFLLDEDLLKDLPFFKDEPTEAVPAKAAAKSPAEPEPAAAGLDLLSDHSDLPPEAPEPSSPPKTVGEESITAGAEQPEEPPPDPGPSLEDFMTQLENRLFETLRDLVEARLPEIVRTVLREEIERLQTDGESQQ